MCTPGSGNPLDPFRADPLLRPAARALGINSPIQAGATVDAEAERAAAEAKAAQSVNAALAADKKRRLAQKSLISAGAPAPTFGDSGTSPNSSPVQGATTTTRSTVARQASLVSRGATL